VNLVATPTARPGSFPLGSLESRAAARALAQNKVRGLEFTPGLELAVADPLTWLQQHTRTRDNHWRESGAKSPYRPFPDKPYFRPILEVIQSYPVSFIEKSRDMMMSWFCVGYFTHAAMTNEQREVLFQSQTSLKAYGLRAKLDYDVLCLFTA
jgi:hypothetical protein